MAPVDGVEVALNQFVYLVDGVSSTSHWANQTFWGCKRLNQFQIMLVVLSTARSALFYTCAKCLLSMGFKPGSFPRSLLVLLAIDSAAMPIDVNDLNVNLPFDVFSSTGRSILAGSWSFLTST